MRLKRTVLLLILVSLMATLLGSSGLLPGEQTERVRAFTRQIEFDYLTWTLDALGVKLGQAALGISAYMSLEARRQQVLDYLDLVRQIQQTEALLAEFYASPDIQDPQLASEPIQRQLEALFDRRESLGPLAEAVLQDQLSAVAAEMGLSLAGQAVPPVLYHSTPLPWALIISPRDQIRQDENISLRPDQTVEDHVTLEESVERALDVSTLVVPIGGIGVYPTMVMQTSDLNWTGEVVAHEWIHNYLTLRPLGLNYETSPELRTMNETAASIAGKEIGWRLIERYYQELLPPPPPPTPQETTPPPSPAEPPAFDFRREMRTTRIAVDELLARGMIDEAEAYMEQRRLVFWDNGYHLRRINQAYFAFYGAYADQPGGAAGEDPVGASVRLLRLQSATLADFINRIAWMSSYEQLQEAVGE